MAEHPERERGTARRRWRLGRSKQACCKSSCCHRSWQRHFPTRLRRHARQNMIRRVTVQLRPEGARGSQASRRTYAQRVCCGGCCACQFCEQLSSAGASLQPTQAETMGSRPPPFPPARQGVKGVGGGGVPARRHRRLQRGQAPSATSRSTSCCFVSLTQRWRPEWLLMRLGCAAGAGGP